MKKEKIKNILVIGKRWFQKSYGNTYCSANIYINGKHVAYIEPTYGYGDYYLQMSMEYLQDNGFIKAEKYPYGGLAYRNYLEKNKINLEYNAIDVSREKDL